MKIVIKSILITAAIVIGFLALLIGGFYLADNYPHELEMTLLAATVIVFIVVIFKWVYDTLK